MVKKAPAAPVHDYIIEGLRPLAVPIADLQIDPRNARTHDRKSLSAIKGSLQQFGQVQPIAVRRKDKVVMAGNGRLQAAQALGWTHMAVVFLDGTERDARAFAIADNRVGEASGWDHLQLTEVMQELAAGGAQFEGLGFSDSELAALVDADEHPMVSVDDTAIVPDDDGVPALEPTPRLAHKTLPAAPPGGSRQAVDSKPVKRGPEAAKARAAWFELGFTAADVADIAALAVLVTAAREEAHTDVTATMYAVRRALKKLRAAPKE